MLKIYIRSLIIMPVIFGVFIGFASCKNQSSTKVFESFIEPDSTDIEDTSDEITSINAILISPANPSPGEGFRIIATGGKNIRKAKIIISNEANNFKSINSVTGGESPYWRIDNFEGIPEGKYKATLIRNKEELCNVEFDVLTHQAVTRKGPVWKTIRSWDNKTEALYSAWINALFQNCDEQTSWPALHEVTQDKSNNVLYNYHSLGEDNPESKTKVIMEPDCADNPFFFRAYFAWKLGLPFGYHICDRGYLGRNPSTGQWITNESPSSKTNPVLAFNSFIRNIMNGVHSGTARTALDNENSDYYPVSLERESLRPGTVYADPYGHTFVLVRWIPQTKDKPGQLLAVDAQPDNTIAIKRFWKGNFLFNTTEVIGEPGFKAFRPILFENGKLSLAKNEAMNTTSGFAQFSMQQKMMDSEVFYQTMERVINPKPLDPEATLNELISALYEQLLVRVKSVANGEAYYKSNPGTVISMPPSARGIFQTGGLWEDYSTPNRDLRLLIAIDAVINFPEKVANSPEDYNISKLSSPDEIRQKLQSVLDKKVSELSISYARTDGSSQELTVAEILKRREAFEMAYNPNDGIEVRWGAHEKSEEISTCRRRAPINQRNTMQSVRKWFINRLHPPT